MSDHFIDLPKCNKWGTPIAKMPCCPNCDEDELGMMRPGYAFCYCCGANVFDTCFRPLTIEEAEQAFKDAPSIPLSKGEVDRIVNAITRKE